MKLSSYLTSQYVLLDLEATSIQEVINKSVEHFALKNEKIAENIQGIKDALLKREEQMSTAIGEGVAIPHARIEGFHDFIAGVAILKEPIKMKLAGKETFDDVKVCVFIMSDSVNNSLILSIMSNFVKLAKEDPKLISNLKVATKEGQVLRILDKTNIELSHDLVAEDILHEGLTLISPDDTLEVVEEKLISQWMRGLPVVSECGEFLGEISEKELIGYGIKKYSDFEDMDFVTVGKPFKEYFKDKKTVTAKSICKIDERAIVEKGTSIVEICFLISSKGFQRLYVLDGNKYIGMISSFEILRKLQNYNKMN